MTMKIYPAPNYECYVMRERSKRMGWIYLTNRDERLSMRLEGLDFIVRAHYHRVLEQLVNDDLLRSMVCPEKWITLEDYRRYWLGSMSRAIFRYDDVIKQYKKDHRIRAKKHPLLPPGCSMFQK